MSERAKELRSKKKKKRSSSRFFSCLFASFEANAPQQGTLTITPLRCVTEARVRGQGARGKEKSRKRMSFAPSMPAPLSLFFSSRSLPTFQLLEHELARRGHGRRGHGACAAHGHALAGGREQASKRKMEERGGELDEGNRRAKEEE